MSTDLNKIFDDTQRQLGEAIDKAFFVLHQPGVNVHKIKEVADLSIQLAEAVHDLVFLYESHQEEIQFYRYNCDSLLKSIEDLDDEIENVEDEYQGDLLTEATRLNNNLDDLIKEGEALLTSEELSQPQ